MAGLQGKLKYDAPRSNLHLLILQSPNSTINHFTNTRPHQTKTTNMVKVGDSIPSVELKEGKPDAVVDLSKELGNGLIIGVPAAFSMLSPHAVVLEEN